VDFGDVRADGATLKKTGSKGWSIHPDRVLKDGELDRRRGLRMQHAVRGHGPDHGENKEYANGEWRGGWSGRV
jgi:hypothetical protein